MKCKNCNRETFHLHVDDLCYPCWGRNNNIEPALHSILSNMYYNLLHDEKHVQVQFFTGKLPDISRQMNKFFEKEKIGKDRLIEIKITKGAILVVYE